MYRVGNLLCIVAILLQFVTGNSPPAKLEFSCDDETGTISITPAGLEEYSSIYAIGTKTVTENGQDIIKDNQLCSVTDASSNSAFKFEIKQCKPDHPVTVYVMKVPSQNQNMGVSPTKGTGTLSPNGFVIGGDGVAAYTLECYKDTNAVNLPDTFKVTKKIALALSSTMSTNAPEGRVYIDMSIRNIDGNPLNTNSMVVIGTKLLVLIKGPAGPAYRVEQCKAYSTNDEKNTTTELVSDKTAHHPELMRSFALVSNDSSTANVKALCNNTFCIETTLYSFRFKSGYSVTVECTIEVCKSKTSGGCSVDNSFVGSALTLHRRKRESDSQLHVLRSTIVVQDHLIVNLLETTSNGNMHRSPFPLTATIAAFCVFRRFA